MAEDKRRNGWEAGWQEGGATTIDDPWEDDLTWPGDAGEATEGTVLTVGQSGQTPWERMLEALESGELSPTPPPERADEEALRASIAERVSAHTEWPARPRR